MAKSRKPQAAKPAPVEPNYTDVIPDPVEEPPPALIAAVAEREPRPSEYAFDENLNSMLIKMASAARQTPQRYLETLVKRAWIGMPSKLR